MGLKETVTQTLVAQAVPEEKAQQMTASIPRGLALVGLGIMLGAAAFGTFYVTLRTLKQEPGMLSMVLVLGFAGASVYFIVSGSNLMTGQALDATANSPIFGRVAKLVRLWKKSA